MTHRERDEAQRVAGLLSPVDPLLNLRRPMSTDNRRAARAKQPPTAPRELTKATTTDTTD